MKIVITGATGNLGTSCVQALSSAGNVREIVGIARRIPRWSAPKTRFVAADVHRDALLPHLRGADVLIHLAWQVQPARDVAKLWDTNVAASFRVFRVAAGAGVKAILYASSIGTYAPGPGFAVDESWPTTGIESSTYSIMKSQVENMLDQVEVEHPEIRIVRMRPSLVFKRQAASGLRQLFIGPALPRFLFRDHGFIVPRLLRLQCVHSLDVGEAFRLAALGDVRGAFNLSAEPLIDRRVFAERFGAHTVSVSPESLKKLTAIAFRMHLLRSEPSWIDLALQLPILRTDRAAEELGWTPRFSSVEALRELLQGLRRGEGWPTPPLAPYRHRPIERRFSLTSHPVAP